MAWGVSIKRRAGFQHWRGGGGRYSPLARRPPPPKKKAQLTPPPKNPTETDPQAPEVNRTQNSAKNENGIFGISAPRGFRKDIICHVFGENFFDNFQCSKKNGRWVRQ